MFGNAGKFIPEEVIASVVSLIGRNEDIQLYAVQKLYSATRKEPTKAPLVYVGVWALGEFGDVLVSGPKEELNVNEEEVVSLLSRILRHPLSTLVAKEYVLNALAKLAIKFSSSSLVNQNSFFNKDFFNLLSHNLCAG